MKHEGLGDTLEAIFRLTGIQAVIYWLADTFNFDCGCEERREFLNNLFNYKKMKDIRVPFGVWAIILTASVWGAYVAIIDYSRASDAVKGWLAVGMAALWFAALVVGWKDGIDRTTPKA